MSRLKDMYKDENVANMIKKFGYKNVMEVPKLDKIVINMGVGEAKDNAKSLESAVKDLETIAGQKVVTTKAKKAVANFKIRQGIKWVDSQGRPVADVKADDFVAGLQHMMDAAGGLEYLAYEAAGIVGAYERGAKVVIDRITVHDGLVWGSYVGLTSGKRRFIALASCDFCEVG